MSRIPMLGTELCSYWVMGNRYTSHRLYWLTCCPMLKQRGTISWWSADTRLTVKSYQRQRLQAEGRGWHQNQPLSMSTDNRTRYALSAERGHVKTTDLAGGQKSRHRKVALAHT